MRAPLSDLPIRFDEVSFAARTVTLLERVSLDLAAGTAPARPRSSVSPWA
jgi:hypothetical protein